MDNDIEDFKDTDESERVAPEKSADGAPRKPYEKPSLETHSDINLWAFGTLGG